MRKIRAVIFLISVILILGCAPTQDYVQYQDNVNSKPLNCELDVYSQGLELNRKTKIIGEMQVGDSGFSTRCDAKRVMKLIKNKACIAGADAIQLFDVHHPSMASSTCFRARARFLIYAE